MVKFLILLPLFIVILNANSITRTQVLMGTYATISLPIKHKKEIQKGFDLIKKIESSLSSYDKSSKVYKLNLDKKIEADLFLLEILQKSKEIYQKSNGYFDITIGSITKKLYHFGQNEQIPSLHDIKKATIDIKGIKITNNFITLKPDITIDLGGIAKGYAIDKVAKYYKSKNIKNAKVALSGDIRVFNFAQVFIQSPFEKKPIIKLQTKLHDISISTSGTYERFVKHSSFNHLINPKTKTQTNNFVSITLITQNNNTLIDAFATAVGVMQELEALKFLLKYPHIGFILIKPNGNIIYANLNPYISKLTLL